METSITILIVDDEEINVEILKDMVLEMGFKEATASNGREALDSLPKVKPDIILLDINMPVMDGYGVLEQIKGSAAYQQIPVIMVSSVDEMESIARCIGMGAEDYLPKPFEPAIMKARITNTVNKVIAARKEKELLEKTLAGSIRILSEILAAVNPAIFGRLSRVRRTVHLMAAELQIGNSWELEVASMLSQIGTIIVPQEILDKISQGKMLLSSEQQLYNRHPVVAAKLISNLPRMDEVAKIVLHQNDGYDGPPASKQKEKPAPAQPQNAVPATPPHEPPTPDQQPSAAPAESAPIPVELVEPVMTTETETVPVGSRILRVALDYELINSIQNNRLLTIELMRKKAGYYDPDMIMVLEKVIVQENNMQIREINLRQLDFGMILVEDVYLVSGQKIISRGQEANYAIIERLRNIAEKVAVREPLKVMLPQPTK